MTQQIQQSDEQRQAAIASNLRRLFPGDGSIFEIRALAPPKPAYSGAFSDYEAAAAHALAVEGMGYAVYFTINQVGRAPDNELQVGAAVKDLHVLRRQWLLVDVDPTRPAGCCSTKEEKDEAQRVLVAAVKWLRAQGWPIPLIGDSGNGYHALFRIDLPSHDDGVVERVLAALAVRFDTPAAKVDQSVFNPSRICRLYGTLNCKGDNTAERPHRLSRLCDGGGTETVPLAALEAVAKQAPATKATSKKPAGGKGEPTASKAAIGAAAVAAQATAQRSDDRPALDAADVITQAQLWAAQQPEAIQGENGSAACFAVACGLVRDWGLSVDEAMPIMEEYSQRCLPPWSEAELEHKLADAMAKAEEEPERVGWRVMPKVAQVVAQEDEGDESEGGRQSQALALVDYVRQRAELWTTPLREAYATVPVDTHRETYEIGDGPFADWLVRGWCQLTHTVPRKAAREEAIDTLACLARAQGERREALVRYATVKEDGSRSVYIDLCDEHWRAVRITAQGWSVVDNPPIRFCRYAGAGELPEPVGGGTLDLLRPFIAVADEEWPLYLAFLVGCYVPTGTYPVLLASGQQGSGKSTLTEATRRLIDPSAIKPAVGVPSDRENLLIAASRSWLQCYNNVSRITEDDSDFLCCLVEGTSYRRRTKHKDKAETVLSAKRPVLVNGIAQAAVRGDLLDRALLVNIQPPAQRRDEQELWASFERDRPAILGALYDAISLALRGWEAVQIEEPRPRLLDFARWATAAEPTLGVSSGTVMAAYRESRQEAQYTAATAWPCWSPLRLLLLSRADRQWSGTASELLAELGRMPDGHAKTRAWPATAQALSMALNRLAPDLASAGLLVESGKSHGARWLRLRFAAGGDDEGDATGGARL